MFGHPAYAQHQYALEICRERGLPYVPYRPDEILAWTTDDLYALPRVDAAAVDEAGWTVVDHVKGDHTDLVPLLHNLLNAGEPTHSVYAVSSGGALRGQVYLTIWVRPTETAPAQGTA